MIEFEQTPGERVASALRRRGMSMTRLIQSINDQRWIPQGDHMSRDGLNDFIDNDLPVYSRGDPIVPTQTVLELARALRVDVEWLLLGIGEPPAVVHHVDPILLSMIYALEDRYGGIIDADERVEIAITALRFIKANGDVDMHSAESDVVAHDFVVTFFQFTLIMNSVLGSRWKDEDRRLYMKGVLGVLDSLTPGAKGTVEMTKAMQRVIDVAWSGWRPEGPQKPFEEWD